jgi:hypothetical protein
LVSSEEDSNCPRRQTRPYLTKAGQWPDPCANPVSLFPIERWVHNFNPVPDSEIDMASSFVTRGRAAAFTLAALLASTSIAGAQQTAAAPPAQTGPKVGDMAPDFSLPGATRYGLLRDPVQLSAMRGKTVVVAFFPKARTRG